MRALSFRKSRPSRLTTSAVSGPIFSNRFGGVVLFLTLFLCIAFTTRVALLLSARHAVDWSLLRILGVFAWGVIFDLAAASYLLTPMVVYLMFLPNRIFMGPFNRYLSISLLLAGIYGLLFLAVTEWLFWQEFGARLNFIAVDYLLYTREVIGNIRESYPLPLVLSILLAFTILIAWGLFKTDCFETWLTSHSPPRKRLIWGAGMLLLPLLYSLGLSSWMAPGFGNVYNQELARNGLYSLVSAFRNNEIEYEEFYKLDGEREAFREMRRILGHESAGFSGDPLDLERQIRPGGKEKQVNVIQITVESLSADFMGAFANGDCLTPNLRAIAEQGIAFTRFYATGTRTDRGMESLTLSVPPTPGRSIIKRRNNENLFTLGSLFQARGYDTVFLYGGYGYFDNMSYFFGHNGYRIVDRSSVSGDAVTFANAWGACDEDLYRWVLAEADRSYAEGKPFFHFVMTTSNHRPFTYPEGRIDIPSHSGRAGAVKYTDYAIGELMREASKKPWYPNTVFVFVADHCANSAGRADLAVNKYRIPLILYNPALLPAQRVDRLCSQIDYPPTLLALLNWSYDSRFYGQNIFNMHEEDERALVANYQKLGYVKDGKLIVLKPVRQESTYRCDLGTGSLEPIAEDSDLTKQARAYYQTASYAFHHRPGKSAAKEQVATLHP